MRIFVAVMTGVMLLAALPAEASEIVVPYFVSAADPEKESVVRVAWPNYYEVSSCDPMPTVTITAYNDDGDRMDPIEVVMPSCETRILTFNSTDLEYGNPDKHIPHGVEGSTMGDWWLRLESDSNFVAQSFVRTSDGLLTPMHDSVPIESRGTYTFNPAANTNQVSFLRIVNTSDTDSVWFGLGGCADTEKSRWCGSYDLGRNRTTLRPGQVLMISAQELEETSRFSGSYWSDYPGGKRQLRIQPGSSIPPSKDLIVQNLMNTPTGHLTNLSTHLGWDTSRTRRDVLYPPKLAPLPRPSSGDYFNIDLQFDSDVSSQIERLVAQAAERWENVIIEGRPARHLSEPIDDCWNENSFYGDVDDILIFVSIEESEDEGPLARGGPCALDGNRRLPRSGRVRFYSEVVARLEGRGTIGYADPEGFFENVAVHEIGHALGFAGHMFERADMLESGSPSRFAGSWTHHQFRAQQRNDDPDGFGVPLTEDESHWGQGVGEIMEASSGTDSRIGELTISALGDLGWRVDSTRYESRHERVSTKDPVVKFIDDVVMP